MIRVHWTGMQGQVAPVPECPVGICMAQGYKAKLSDVQNKASLQGPYIIRLGMYVQAEGLSGTERHTHPFVRVCVAEQSLLSSVQWNSLDPVWEETLQFRYGQLMLRAVHCRL